MIHFQSILFPIFEKSSLNVVIIQIDPNINLKQYQDYIMSNEEGQLHLIKTTVLLKKVSITVRFPCSISFSLKHQNHIVDHRGIYELKGGESLINQTIGIEVEVPYVRGKYEPLKILLMICMVSANGKIPAGTVTINPTQKIVVDKRSPLEKCPDKNAEVTFTATYEKVQVLKKINDIRRSRVNLTASSVSGYNFLNGSRIQQYASSSNLIYKHEMDGESRQSSSNLDARKQDQMNSYKSIEQKNLRSSKVGSQGEKKSFPKFTKNRYEQGKRSLYGTSEKDPSESRISRASNQVNEGHQWQMESQKSKILKLQQEKTGYIKQIAKLKGSLVRVQSEERFQIEDQLNNMMKDKTHLEDEVEKMREKSKFQEKRQRESGSLLKQLRDELDKKKSRIVQLDSSKHEIEGQLSQKDRLINSLQSEKRKLQEALEQEKVLQQSFQKRLELKQNSYKEQIKKINQKYSQSEMERQKAMIDYNNILLQIENGQKRNQIQYRQKEKAYNEQKSKLNKKIEQLLLETSHLQENLSDNNNTIRDYEYLKSKRAEEEKDREEKIKTIKQNYDSLLIEKKNLQTEKKSLEEELRSLQKLYNEDKVNYKKKYNESSNELLICKDKLDKQVQLSNSQEVKIKELQSKLERDAKQRISINSKFEQLKKLQQRYMQDQQNRERLAETLSMQNMTQNNKLGEFKSKLQAERKRYELMETKYEQQVQYLVKSKDYLENEIEEMKWLLEKEMEKFETLSIKHRQLNDQIIDLNQQTIQLEQKLATSDHEREEDTTKIANLQFQITNLQNKNKSIYENLKRKEEEYFSVEKKGNTYQQDLFILQQNLQITIKNMNEKIVNLERTIAIKSSQLNSKEEELTLLNEEFYEMRSNQVKQKSDMSNKINQITGLKELNKTLKADFNVALSKNQDLNTQLQRSSQKMEQLENNLKFINDALRLANQQLDRKQNDHEQYKSTVKRVIEQFIGYFSKEELSEKKKEHTSLQLLPDHHLANLQTQCLKKYYNNWQRQQQIIRNQANSITYLEQDMQKLKMHAQKIHEEYEVKLLTEQQTQKIYRQEKLQQAHQLQERINELLINLEEKKNQIEFFRSSTCKYEDMISEFTDQAVRSQQKESELKKQIDSFEKQIFQFKQKEIKGKVIASTESQEVKRFFSEEKTRNEQLIKSFKESIKAKDKLLNERAQQLKRNILIQSQFQLNQEKYIRDINELRTKLEEEQIMKKNIERLVQDRERTIKELQEEALRSRLSQEHQRQTQKQKEEEIKKIRSQYHNLEDICKTIEEEYRNKYGSLLESQKKQREKREKIEILKTKIEQQHKEGRQKCVRLESEVQFYKFYKQQTSKKLEQYQKFKEENYMQMIRCKENIIRSQKEIGSFQNKYYKLQMEIEHLTKEKDTLRDANNKLREKLDDHEDAFNNLNRIQNELTSKDKDIERLNEKIQLMEQQNEKIMTQIKNNLNKYKEELNIKVNRIKELEKKLQEKNSDVMQEKQRIMTEYNNERNMYEIKLQTLKENARVLDEELEFQKEQSIKQIEGANAIIQELNQVIRQKQQTLQYREQVINQQNVRLDQMNLQLNECVNKWQKEKEIYIPASGKVTEIGEELLRMNTFISDLDGRNKQLLQINKRKMQQTLESKQSITQMLKQLYVLLQKNKNRILNRCQTEKQKETVVLQFKVIQEKLDLTLKCTQITNVKQ